jgi:putative flippase GtrA
VQRAYGQIFRFCVVGSIGFLVDAGLTMLLYQTLHWSPEQSRVVGFMVAATATWEMNRRFTFRSTAGAESWIPYIVLATIGAFINFGVFVAWLRFAGETPLQILIGIALGALVAMSFTFTIARRYVFRSR